MAPKIWDEDGQAVSEREWNIFWETPGVIPEDEGELIKLNVPQFHFEAYWHEDHSLNLTAMTREELAQECSSLGGLSCSMCKT